MATSSVSTTNDRTGSDAFLRLMVAVSEQTNSDFEAADGESDEADPRDYLALADIVERALVANFVEGTPAHRRGFVRALADLISINVDGAGAGATGWDPLKSSEAAFAAPGLAAAVIAVARAVT